MEPGGTNKSIRTAIEAAGFRIGLIAEALTPSQLGSTTGRSERPLTGSGAGGLTVSVHGNRTPEPVRCVQHAGGTSDAADCLYGVPGTRNSTMA